MKSTANKSATYQAHGGELKNLMLGEKELQKIQKKLLTLPRINLSTRQVCDLELLMTGAFSPLAGFMNKKDYESVISNMRLADGTVWPMPVVLDIENKRFKVGSEIILCDEFGKPLAMMSVESVYKPDKKKEAQAVYGTTGTDHFGVNYLLKEVKDYYIGGSIKGISEVERHDFSHLRLTPSELQQFFREQGWEKVIAFQTRNPLHKVHYNLIKTAAQEHNAKVLLHPAVGMTKDGDVDYITRIRSYIKMHKYIKDFAMISLLPLAMRMAGPREALWHAIIRKNYGCTHFIVGRDHASPGKDSKGINFYGPYDAQTMVEQYADEIGIVVVPFKEMVYVEELSEYSPIDRVDPSHTIKSISGTEVRKMLVDGADIPEWFSFPEIVDELRKGVVKQKKDGVTIFFTGLSGAGKSTIARILYYKLIELQDKPVTLLDGDIVRQNLSKGLGFSRDDRNENIKRIGFVANLITKHGGIAICSAIAPYAESRDMNRKLISKNGMYIEVHVSTPLEVCMKRDTKQLYQKSKMGIIKGLTGVDDPYEEPVNPELIINTSDIAPQESVAMIMDYLVESKVLTSEL